MEHDSCNYQAKNRMDELLQMIREQNRKTNPESEAITRILWQSTAIKYTLTRTK